MTSRRKFLRASAVGLALPFVRRLHAVAPSATLRHASFGASGMAWEDIQSLTASPHVKLVAVAEVDQTQLKQVKEKFPDARIYSDGRELLDKEKELDSVNVSTPDHMHALFARRAIDRGLHAYCQKPLTHTLHEARVLTEAAATKKVVTQMGIQIHSHQHHLTVVQLIRSNAVGKIKEVHSWSGKGWGDTGPRPKRNDPIPAGMAWDLWLGGAAERSFIAGYYHPAVWRKRLDFGTGTFGDMACHILDPVFTSLALAAPTMVTSVGPPPGEDSWNHDVQVSMDFPASAQTAGPLKLSWYNGDRKPPAQIQALVAPNSLSGQGTIYVGEKGVLYSPYIGAPVLLPSAAFRDYAIPTVPSVNHYLQFVNACRGEGATTTPFSYSGPLTEAVLLGCLATRFPQQELQWDEKLLKVKNVAAANEFVRTIYRQGWEVS